MLKVTLKRCLYGKHDSKKLSTYNKSCSKGVTTKATVASKVIVAMLSNVVFVSKQFFHRCNNTVRPYSRSDLELQC
jgi:hypothetical protein